MHSLELRKKLYDIDAELDLCTNQRGTMPFTLWEYERMDVERLEAANYRLFRVANSCIEAPLVPPRPPQSSLGRKVVAVAQMVGRLEVDCEEDIGDRACFQAELRLLRALDRQVQGGQTLDKDHMPSVFRA